MDTTYCLVIERELRAEPIRKTTHEGVRDLDMAIIMARNEAILHYDDMMERKAELAVTGRTAWSYGFTNVTIEREQQAANKEE